MVQSLTIPHTFDEFIAWYPEQSGHRYELHNGEDNNNGYESNVILLDRRP